MSTFGTFNVAMLGAHGLTDRTIRTWNPTIPRDPRVMVPVVVDALVVRQAGAKWADTLMKRTPSTGDLVPAKDLLPKPFALREETRAPGVYLHWSLPDALTRGTQAAGAQASSPAVPDRWLITRLSPSATTPSRRAMRGWILQAHDDNPQPLDLDTWTEPGVPPAGIKGPLNALGYGDLSWAGFFDNTQNRLAFYDDLKDVKAGPVAYLVCGWYSEPSQDPLGPAAVHSLAEFYARMQELGWALPDGDLDQAQNAAANHVVAAKAVGLPVSTLRAHPAINRMVATSAFDPQSLTFSSAPSWWPQMSILHGSVVGIGWPTNATNVWNPKLAEPVGGPPDPSTIKVAIGNTVTEAMAKLVAVDQNRADETRILEAFQLNALETLNDPDGAAQVDSLLHANAFGSISAGETTETIWQPPTSVNQAAPANPPAPPAGVFSRYQSASNTGIVGGLRGNVNLGAAQLSPIVNKPVRTPAFLNQTQVIAGNLLD
ncbi:MAG TPA: hypothetical protein DCK99_14170, partial [Blastocatellia bacterium]|nr:hypothetical protein [Blastocatellia bacterium]